MSGVLDRMAKRALGLSPTIQPLAAPRYSPPVRVLQEGVIEPETDFALEATVPHIEREQGLDQLAYAEAALNQAATDERHEQLEAVRPPQRQPQSRPAEARRTQDRAPSLKLAR